MSNPNKTVKYRMEKTPKEVAKRYIKRKSRYHYSLDEQKCETCNAPAECRHHTTDPIEFDKFQFLCNRCHKEVHYPIITKFIQEVK